MITLGIFHLFRNKKKIGAFSVKHKGIPCISPSEYDNPHCLVLEIQFWFNYNWKIIRAFKLNILLYELQRIS